MLSIIMFVATDQSPTYYKLCLAKTSSGISCRQTPRGLSVKSSPHSQRITFWRGTAVVKRGGMMRIVLRTLLGRTEQQAWELTKPHCSFFVYAGAPASEEVSQ